MLNEILKGNRLIISKTGLLVYIIELKYDSYELKECFLCKINSKYYLCDVSNKGTPLKSSKRVAKHNTVKYFTDLKEYLLYICNSMKERYIDENSFTDNGNGRN